MTNIFIFLKPQTFENGLKVSEIQFLKRRFWCTFHSMPSTNFKVTFSFYHIFVLLLKKCDPNWTLFQWKHSCEWVVTITQVRINHRVRNCVSFVWMRVPAAQWFHSIRFLSISIAPFSFFSPFSSHRFCALGHRRRRRQRCCTQETHRLFNSIGNPPLPSQWLLLNHY